MRRVSWPADTARGRIDRLAMGLNARRHLGHPAALLQRL